MLRQQANSTDTPKYSVQIDALSAHILHSKLYSSLTDDSVKSICGYTCLKKPFDPFAPSCLWTIIAQTESCPLEICVSKDRFYIDYFRNGISIRCTYTYLPLDCKIVCRVALSRDESYVADASQSFSQYSGHVADLDVRIREFNEILHQLMSELNVAI